jgi:hypothetical protein
LNQIETNEYWKDILEKFSKYEGTISGFCREYDVNIHRLYYQRKKLRKKNKCKAALLLSPYTAKVS